MDKFHKKLDNILVTINGDKEIKKEITDKITYDMTKSSFNEKKYNLKKKVKEYYEELTNIFLFTIKKRLKATDKLEEEHLESMVDVLGSFINIYIFKTKTKDLLFEYSKRLYDILYARRIYKLGIDEWLEKSTEIINPLNRLVKKFIKAMKDSYKLSHIEVTEKQLLNLMYNFMNKHNDDDRLKLYIDVNKYSTKNINSKTSENVLLKHMYYKSYSNKSYHSAFEYNSDMIHLICIIFTKMYKSISK